MGVGDAQIRVFSEDLYLSVFPWAVSDVLADC